MTTGEKLQALRKKKGYTQEDLAELLGVSRQSVSKWESDSAFPETEKLIELSKIYKCSIDYLLKSEQEGDESIAPAEKKLSQKEIWDKALKYTKRNNFFTSCFVLLYSIIEFLLYLMPVVLLYAIFINQTVEVKANIYNLITASNYKAGNYIFLAMFLLHLSLLGLGLAYGFCPKKKIYTAIPIVMLVKLLLTALGLLVIWEGMQVGIILLLVYDIAAAVLFFVLPRNKFKN